MTQYLYPQNLKATANLWLWGLRDFCILGIAALLSIVQWCPCDSCYRRPTGRP